MGSLLGAAELAAISSLRLSPKRRVSGFAAGEQRSPARGGGIEFLDFREYRPGDDLRQVDWPASLRLGLPMVKLRAEEREASLIIILDLSASMGGGDGGKLKLAKRLCCLLAGVALRGGDRAGICALNGEGQEILRPERGRSQLGQVEALIGALECRPDFSPLGALRYFASRYGGKCVCLLISDLLFPEWPEALGILAASGCEAYVAHILSEEELKPRLRGELTLVDSESGRELPLHVDARVLGLYQSALEDFLGATRTGASRLGLGYVLAKSTQAASEIARTRLCQAGLLC